MHRIYSKKGTCIAAWCLLLPRKRGKFLHAYPSFLSLSSISFTSFSTSSYFKWVYTFNVVAMSACPGGILKIVLPVQWQTGHIIFVKCQKSTYSLNLPTYIGADVNFLLFYTRKNCHLKKVTALIQTKIYPVSFNSSILSILCLFYAISQ